MQQTNSDPVIQVYLFHNSQSAEIALRRRRSAWTGQTRSWVCRIDWTFRRVVRVFSQIRGRSVGWSPACGVVGKFELIFSVLMHSANNLISVHQGNQKYRCEDLHCVFGDSLCRILHFELTLELLSRHCLDILRTHVEYVGRSNYGEQRLCDWECFLKLDYNVWKRMNDW